MNHHVLDPRRDPVDLTQDFVDIASESGDEHALADAVEAGLRHIVQAAHPDVRIERKGNCVVALTQRGLPQRVILAGHLDTVPIANNVPSWRGPGTEGEDCIHGCGSVDMKSGDAVLYHLFHALADHPALAYDMTLVFYDCEEVEAVRNGLGALRRHHPELLAGDVAILGEPTSGVIEAGCQGTLRLRIVATGKRAHAARSWMGSNAIHLLAPVMEKLSIYTPRVVTLDGCHYREGLNAVRMAGGVAGNVIPPEAWVEVNYRFAPDRSESEALHAVCTALNVPLPATTNPGGGGDAIPSTADDSMPALRVEILDSAPGALPGLTAPALVQLVEAAGGKVGAKFGWTDVSRFATMGCPAVNLGPGNPGLAHTKEEHCPVSHITEVTEILRRYLTTPPTPLPASRKNG